ncbi:hypothetical protein [Rhodophyticola sp.]|jgi:uncharacterized membrane protein|uniref:hypothetical protein n=1 Tax=Rhodophyticola sp. TaxID=2680032 RepID=UPI003D26526B
MEPDVILIIAGTGLASAALAFVLGRFLSPRFVYLFWACVVAFALWILIGMAAQVGWDALGSAVVLLFVALPAIIGAVGGGLLGMRARRAAQAGGDRS